MFVGPERLPLIECCSPSPPAALSEQLGVFIMRQWCRLRAVVAVSLTMSPPIVSGSSMRTGGRHHCCNTGDCKRKIILSKCSHLPSPVCLVMRKLFSPLLPHWRSTWHVGAKVSVHVDLPISTHICLHMLCIMFLILAMSARTFLLELVILVSIMLLVYGSLVL